MGQLACKRSSAGGVTLTQTPESARFVAMPRSAIASDSVDFVLSPREIARELTRLGSHPYLAQPSGSPEEAATASDVAFLRRIFRRLRAIKGVDFTHYKRNTLRRRLARRMALRQVDELPTTLPWSKKIPRRQPPSTRTF